MERSRLLLILYVVVSCSLVGGLAYGVLFYRSVYQEARKQLATELSVQTRLAASLWRYGFVESVDMEKGTFIARVEDRSSTEEEQILLLIRTTGESRIAEQRLVRSGDTYSELGETRPATLADLRPDMRIAVLLENRPEEKALVAQVVLFGNPL